MKIVKLLAFTCLLLGFISCGKKEKSSQREQSEKPKITIATAANMQFAMAELTKEFTKQTAIECEMVISSSGKLTAQIKEGAPYDIFISANMKYPWEVYHSGLAENKPKIYAYGKLVLWTMVEGIEPSLDLFTDKSIHHIALANPKTAPYGLAATDVLDHHNIYEKVKGKLVFGESISQTNQFINSKAAEIGFTALSVVLSPEMRGKGKWIEMEESTYSPIEQGVVVIKHDRPTNKIAIKFYEFLFSDKAQKVLTDFGYAIHE